MASIGQPGKKYGLIIPKKPSGGGGASGAVKKVVRPPPATATRGAFGLDDSDDEDALKSKEAFNAALQSRGSKASVRQMEAAKKAALEEDPSIFDYDGVYEQINEAREQKADSQKAEKAAQKSQYIEQLQRAADIRKIEQERFYERRLLKERKEEDEQYGDKEKFVTNAYKEKLKAMKRWEILDKLQEEQEKKNDVTEKGMDGFFSNFLSNNIAMGGDVKTAAISAYTPGSKVQEMMLKGNKGAAPPPPPPDEEEEEEEERKVGEGREEDRGPSSRMVDVRRGWEEEGKKRPREKGEEEGGVDSKAKKEKKEEAAAAVPPPAPSEPVKDAATIKAEKEEAIRKARERFLARKKGGGS